VVNVHRAGAPPLLDARGTEALGPTAGKAEGGRQQHRSSHFGVARGIERREISAHAGADQRDRIPGGGAFHDRELAGDGEMLEIAGREVGSVHPCPGVFQPLTEVVGLGRRR